MRLTRVHFRALADGLKTAQEEYGIQNPDEAMGFSIAVQGICSALQRSNQNFDPELFMNYVIQGKEKPDGTR